MKPRIKKIAGIWYCRSVQATGLGYTPSMAYEVWVDLTLKFWRNV